MAKSKGPGRATQRGRSAQGRAHPKGSGSQNPNVGRYTSAEETGRYTRPTPRDAKVSPRWWGPTMLALMLLGMLLILLNYLSVFGTPSGWLLIVGLAIIGAGFMMATRYR